MMRKVVVISVLVSMAACAHSTAPESLDVLLVSPKNAYSAGETISIELFNRSESGVQYGACSAQLERLNNNRWVPVEKKPDVCEGILYTLAAGSSRVLKFALSRSLDAGTYRIEQELVAPERTIHSTSFDVSPSIEF
jgi:hypothetical protein